MYTNSVVHFPVICEYIFNMTDLVQLIILFKKYLLSIYYELVTVVDDGVIAISQRDIHGDVTLTLLCSQKSYYLRHHFRNAY